MAGPWEDYAPKKDEKVETGPWSDYAEKKSEKDTSFLSALQHGVASQVSGYGATARAAGASGAGKAVQGAGSAIAPDNYDTASDKVGLNPGTWGNIPRAVAESAPGLATDLAAGAAGAGVGSIFGPIGSGIGGLGGFLASSAARNFGNNVNDRVKYQDPKKEIEDATGKDMAIAGAATAGEAALNRLGLKGIPLPGGGKVFTAIENVAPNVAKGLAGGAVDAVTKGAGAQAIRQIPGQVAGAGIREGAFGAAGNVVNQVGRTIDTDKGLSIDPNEMANAAVLSGATGAALRGARGVPDAIQSSKMASLMENPEAHARLTERLANTGENLQKDRGFGEAVRRTHDDLKIEYKAARQPMKALLKNEPELSQMVDQAYSRVSKQGRGRPLQNDELTTLRDRLTGSPEGDALFQTIESLHALQQVKALGNWRGGDSPTLSGGAADTAFVKALQPSNWKAMAGAGGLAAGASMVPAAALAAIPGAAAIAPFTPAIAAVPFAVKGAAKAWDGAFGLTSPGAQYMSRFSDFKPPAPPPPGGSARPGSPGSPAPVPPAGPAPQAAPAAPVAPGAMPISPAPASGAPRLSIQEFLALQNRIKVPKGVAEEPAPKAPAGRVETPSDTPIETTAKTAVKAEKAKAKLDENTKPVREHAKSDAAKGWIEIEGKKWEIPDTAKDPVAWAAGLRSNQQNIIGAFKRAEKLDISDQAKTVVRDHLDDMREARYQSDARDVKETILSKITDETDRKKVAYHFGDPFFARWSKAKRD